MTYYVEHRAPPRVSWSPLVFPIVPELLWRGSEEEMHKFTGIEETSSRQWYLTLALKGNSLARLRLWGGGVEKSKCRKGISGRENGQQNSRQNQLKFLAMWPPTLRTLGSSIVGVAEGLAETGRKPESGIILEKISSTITSNRDTKM